VVQFCGRNDSLLVSLAFADAGTRRF